MQELDLWTDANVIGPLETNDPKLQKEWEIVVERVKQAIRTKVLESYRNGQVAGPRASSSMTYRHRAVSTRRKYLADSAVFLIALAPAAVLGLMTGGLH